MEKYCLRIANLIWGLFVFSFGVVVIINAQIGYAPWDVFHVGLANTTGLSIGNTSIIVGIVVIILVVLLGEKIGLGTVFNGIFVGLFLDLILGLKIIPVADNIIVGIFMIFIGLFILSLGTFFYMKTALGAGPRDSLMVGLTRKTGLPIGVCRGIIEVSVVLIGWKLGGMVGVGTVLAAFTVGFCVQITFKLLKFDAIKVKHESINYTYKILFRKL